MLLSQSIARQLLLLCSGGAIPSSKLDSPIITDLIAEGIITVTLQGRTKRTLTLPQPEHLYDYLHNHFGITNLDDYVSVSQLQDLKRADLVKISADSKLKAVRTFRGFLVNSYSPVHALLNNAPLVIQPCDGSYTFIHDFESFIPPASATIVGIENSENFRYIHLQTYLFPHISPLFVCRYPQSQSRDVITGLKGIPNPYLHFGDYDLAGVGIYLHEYKRHLGNKATFFIPPNIADLLSQYGNRTRYDTQTSKFDLGNIQEQPLSDLISLLHQHKKGLDQEIFINASAQNNSIGT